MSAKRLVKYAQTFRVNYFITDRIYKTVPLWIWRNWTRNKACRYLMPVLVRLKRKIPTNMRYFFGFNKFWDILQIIRFIQSNRMLSALIHEIYKTLIKKPKSKTALGRPRPRRCGPKWSALLWQSNKLSVFKGSEDSQDKPNNYQFLNEDPALWKHDITLYICITLPTR
jgi:hypothetical protein